MKADPNKVTAVQLAALARAKLNDHYRDVFGAEGRRNVSQEAVWRDLTSACYLHRPVFQADKDGKIDALKAAYTDGMRSVLLYVQENISSESATQT